MDKQELHLEEYRILLTTISHIFMEFWWGNAFFVSFFSIATTALVANIDKVGDLPNGAIACLGVGVILVATVWMLTNVKHNYYLSIHIDHAIALENDLGCSIFSRRTVPMRGLARLSVRKLWIAAPVVFVLMGVTILIVAKLSVSGSETVIPSAPPNG